MRLNSLRISQIRAFEQAEFNFQAGMNLIIGINGVGKSTLLDILRTLLSQVLPKISASTSKPISFNEDDISFNRGALTAEMRFEAGNVELSYLAHMPRRSYIANKDQDGQVRGQTIDLVEHYDLWPDDPQTLNRIKASSIQPLAVYFSTQRSLSVMTSQRSTSKGKSAAYLEALTTRELRLREFADWMLVQQALAEETEADDLFRRHIEVLKETVTLFLDGCTNLRAVREPQTTMLVDKNGSTLDVRQLSDGERGLLSLVLDLARRLSIANPELADPLKDGQAVILIDELDLHLHPGWQRDIVEKLSRTFPQCQFIATSHSPQIVGEIPAESIIILEAAQPPYHPDRSLGMDSNWILQFLMGTKSRKDKIIQKLDQISELIEDEQYDQAEQGINQLRESIGDFTELVILQTRLDRLRLLGE